jgi:mRNA interferase MazF
VKYKFGDIVIISFPFAESGITKKRPALVILDSGDNDIVAARITSQASEDNNSYNINDWKKAGLLLPSFVKLDKIATLNKNLIFTKLKNLSDQDFNGIKKTFNKIWCS